MRFSIVTPSFRNSDWLKLCISSVADQSVELEHIVQDAGSDDGTLDWLLKDQRVTTFVEKDQGMYDAVNRGFSKSSGEICAYLNCDEQYQPGALAAVEQFFQRHPAIEIVFGHSIVVNAQGEFLCHRKSLLPLKAHSMVSSNLSILTCGTFFRRSIFEKRGLVFNPQMRALGDADWLIRCLKQDVPMGLLDLFTSVFTNTGKNLSFNADARRENVTLLAAAPPWLRACRPLIIAHHRVRKWLQGGYRQLPFDYSIYTTRSPEKRVSFHVAHPVARWVR